MPDAIIAALIMSSVVGGAAYAAQRSTRKAGHAQSDAAEDAQRAATAAAGRQAAIQKRAVEGAERERLKIQADKDRAEATAVAKEKRTSALAKERSDRIKAGRRALLKTTPGGLGAAPVERKTLLGG
tara:strand:- start:1482 stop:1862 length:381 start_codon:yes stop_codon:yes gene_type:complete